MITKVFRACSVGSVLRALYRGADGGPGAGVHLIASWDEYPSGLEPELDSVTGRADVGRLGRLLMQPVRVCERAPEEVVFHVAVRNAPEDRRLSDDEWAQVCVSLVDRTGMAAEEDLAACRWVAVRAGDGLVHVVATLAREDGREPNMWNSYWRLREVANEYEQQCGLRPTSHVARPA